MKSSGFVIGAIILGLIIYGAYYFYNDTYEQTMLEIQNTTPVAPIPSVTEADIATDSGESTSTAIPADWKLSNSSKYGYSIRFPKNMQSDTTSEGDRYYFMGPTQSLGTELYDGISLLIKSHRYNGKTIKEVATERHDIMEKEETTKSITSVSEVGYRSVFGYKFRREALGDADFIYIPMNKDEYLEVINMTVEPENAKNDPPYTQIVEQMISSIKPN